ncbi:hypothetical protein [Caballeronia glebae]|uniref:hypothetical protein n=1 Tax=Caballeronia glebae TaxID=1777143 RepID=UPI0038BAD709
MPRPAHPDRLAAIDAIRQHAWQYGADEGPRRARLRFPDIAAPTWTRWCQTALGLDRAMADEIKQVVPRPDMPISPRTTKELAATRRAIDFHSVLDRMAADAELMAEYSTSVDAGGLRKLENPVTLQAANRMRGDVLKLAIRHAEAVWNVERLQALYDSLIEEIGSASPEVQRRVLERTQRVEAAWSQVT